MAFRGQGDYKNKLVQFVQMKLGRSLSKTDIIYTTDPSEGRWQSTVNLECLGNGEQFTGEPADTEKWAQQNAAQQAVEHFADQIATMDSLGPKGPNGEPLNKKQRKARDHKKDLMRLVSHITGRQCTSEDIQRESVVSEGVHACVIVIPSLPGKWAKEVFQGSTASSKSAGEQSAAEVAVQGLLTEPEFADAWAAVQREIAEGIKLGDNVTKDLRQELGTAVQRILRKNLANSGLETAEGEENGGIKIELKIPELPDEHGLLVWEATAATIDEARKGVFQQALDHIKSVPEFVEAIAKQPPSSSRTGVGKGKAKGKGKFDGSKGWGMKGEMMQSMMHMMTQFMGSMMKGSGKGKGYDDWGSGGSWHSGADSWSSGGGSWGSGGGDSWGKGSKSGGSWGSGGGDSWGKGGKSGGSWGSGGGDSWGKGGKSGGKWGSGGGGGKWGGKQIDNDRNLKITNLPAEAESEHLRQLGEQIGQVTHATVNGGQGRIEFASAAEAATAMPLLDGAQVGDNVISARAWT